MPRFVKRMILASGILMLMFSLYVFSYAPTLKLVSMYEQRTGTHVSPWACMDFYKPVLWCFWWTPLRAPLSAWAEVWDVEWRTSTQASSYRRDVRPRDLSFQYKHDW